MFASMIQQRVLPPGESYTAKPYQVFGFDILIDENMKSWMLEINDGPSFNIHVCTEEKYKRCKHENCDISEVDLYVKKALMTDVLELAFASRDPVQFEEMGTRFKSLERLIPLENKSHQLLQNEIVRLGQYFA